MLVERVEAGEATPPANILALLARLEEASAKVERQVLDNDADISIAITTRPEQAKSETDETEKGIEELASDHASLSVESLTAQNDETIRVSIRKLDALMAQFSELLGAKIRAEQRLVDVRYLQQTATDWQKEWTTVRGRYGRLVRNGQPDASSTNDRGKDMAALVDFAAHNQERLRTFNSQSNILYRELANDTMRLSLIIDELQEEIKRVRMLPLSTITTAFGRMVRDLAREQGKQIKLTINGAETELDKRVLEQIKDPLIHLLRNAVDHGLETTDARTQAGKTAEGQIVLAASQQGNNVVISVSDDGLGARSVCYPPLSDSQRTA